MTERCRSFVRREKKKKEGWGEKAECKFEVRLQREEYVIKKLQLQFRISFTPLLLTQEKDFFPTSPNIRLFLSNS